MSQIRKSEIDAIYNVLTNESFANQTLNIDGIWGIGKTHVAKQLIEEIKKTPDKFIVLNIDLSDYDYCNDPLIPFLYIILDYINDSEEQIDRKKKILTLFATALNIISCIDQTGISKVLSCIVELTKKPETDKSEKTMIEQKLSDFGSYQQALRKFGEGIDELCKIDDSNKKKVILFIDDFDRANPQLCYKVLSIIHKLKSITDNLQLCTVMNRAQLESQIIHMYGEISNSSGENYLTKYIDLEISIDNPCKDSKKVDSFMQELGLSDINNKFFRGLAEKLSVRELWKKALAKANIEYRNPHQMRHTFISYMLSVGNKPNDTLYNGWAFKSKYHV